MWKIECKDMVIIRHDVRYRVKWSEKSRVQWAESRALSCNARALCKSNVYCYRPDCYISDPMRLGAAFNDDTPDYHCCRSRSCHLLQHPFIAQEAETEFGFSYSTLRLLTVRKLRPLPSKLTLTLTLSEWQCFYFRSSSLWIASICSLVGKYSLDY